MDKLTVETLRCEELRTLNIADLFIIISFTLLIAVLFIVVLTLIILYVVDRKQKQHPVLRNYPLIGRVRYFLETIGPEMRQYFFDNDREGRPLSRMSFQHIVRKAKYKRDVIGFGTRKNFDVPGYYIRNAMFPKLLEELMIDRQVKVTTNRYLLVKEPLFARRKEYLEKDESVAYLLDDQDKIVIGPDTEHPFVVKGQIGMSAMSYGSLGNRAVTTLSKGLALARGTWMNTGEGGLSSYHLSGGVDLIMQIGPGLYGVRDINGNFSWDTLKKQSEIPQVRAFELKLAQGAKIRGGHVDAEKVTEEIAKIRMVEPFKSIDSPNRFHQFHDTTSMLKFVEKMRQHTGKPVGIKVVIGSFVEAAALAKQIKKTGVSPDFITLDGGEGGTGASYQELADSVGLPIKSALPLLDGALKKYKVRDQLKIIASGSLFSPDRVAVALAMGADLVNIARGFMITIGCIQALKCHTNACPVGVATTDPDLQKALVIREKKYRVANYCIAMRQGLFRLAAAAGIDSPVHFSKGHIVYKDEKGAVQSLEEIYDSIVKGKA